MTKARKFTEITGTITTADGETRQFSIVPDLGWQQWGAVREVLGNSVDIVEAMATAAAEHGYDPDGEERE